jgi:hypothetical protein
MKNWCTIKTDGEHQILLFKDEDEEENAVIRVKKKYEDYLVEMAMCYGDDDNRRDVNFDRISSDNYKTINSKFFWHLDIMKLADE